MTVKRLPMPPSPPRKLVVSIINFRTGPLTLNCVRSVLADLDGTGADRIDAEIIVVDNRSGDGSDALIADWIAAQPQPVPVRLIRSATNAGFSGGHNQAIAAQAAEFYLVLNSDALLRPGFLSSILAAAQMQPAAGLLAPRIEYEDGRQQTSCFRFPGPFSELVRGANSGPVTRFFARHVVALDMPPENQKIEWASFACILLRRSMIDAIGLMDEGYFLYFEDTEYCLRARKAGWRITYVPDARAVHFRGGSGPVKALSAARKGLPAYFYASRSRFLCQAHGRAGLLAANLLWCLGRVIAHLRRLVGKPVFPSNQNEMRDIWINAFAPLGTSSGKAD